MSGDEGPKLTELDAAFRAGYAAIKDVREQVGYDPDDPTWEPDAYIEALESRVAGVTMALFFAGEDTRHRLLDTVKRHYDAEMKARRPS